MSFSCDDILWLQSMRPEHRIKGCYLNEYRSASECQSPDARQSDARRLMPVSRSLSTDTRRPMPAIARRGAV